MALMDAAVGKRQAGLEAQESQAKKQKIWKAKDKEDDWNYLLYTIQLGGKYDKDQAIQAKEEHRSSRRQEGK